MLPYLQCIPVAVCFPIGKPNRPHNRTSVATFLSSANRTTNLTAFPWQPIFISAQGSSYTIKTVGGEAVRRFFSLKYAVLLYTLSTLFRELSLHQQKSFRKVFCERARTLFLRRSEAECIFPKKRQRVLASPAAMRLRADICSFDGSGI